MKYYIEGIPGVAMQTVEVACAECGGKMEVLTPYGGGEVRCSDCGDDDEEFELEDDYYYGIRG